MAYSLDYYDAAAYEAPVPEQDLAVDDPLAEPEWTASATTLAITVVAICAALVTLV